MNFTKRFTPRPPLERVASAFAPNRRFIASRPRPEFSRCAKSGDGEFAQSACLPSGMSVCLMASVLQQQTISRPATYSGIGLHSGGRVNMTFLPAPPGAGIRFRRVDLEGKPEVEARVENVAETNRSTSLARGNVKVHTVEHVLATFAGCGIDNAIVELDANEPPIADGSSREYCKMIESAGIVSQPERREP